MWPQCLISSCDEVLAQCRTYFSPNVIEKYVVAFKLDAEDDNPHYRAYFSLRRRNLDFYNTRIQCLDLLGDKCISRKWETKVVEEVDPIGKLHMREILNVCHDRTSDMNAVKNNYPKKLCSIILTLKVMRRQISKQNLSSIKLQRDLNENMMVFN
ncbi:13707_t:CDS:2 [Funneliformis geosporum]|nr:13707_t:CDS:2 [Funneliformis geosporum]